MDEEINPERIIDMGLGFFASKTLLSAVELGVFTELTDGPLTKGELEKRLELHPRCSEDFLDALVTLDLLDRSEGEYQNVSETAMYLDETKETYLGDFFDLATMRLYPFWGDLTKTLQSGDPQNKADEDSYLFFEEMYDDRAYLRQFQTAMTAFNKRSTATLVEEFAWEKYESVCDLGAGEGELPVQIAAEYQHIDVTAFDVPDVKPISERFIEEKGFDDRITCYAGDFFEDNLPHHDIFILGHILHDWGVSERKTIIQNAYNALPDEGALIVYGVMIDSDRRENELALLLSLNMMIHTLRGSEYTLSECKTWMRDAGFATTEVRDLPGPESMIVAKK